MGANAMMGMYTNTGPPTMHKCKPCQPDPTSAASHHALASPGSAESGWRRATPEPLSLGKKHAGVLISSILGGWLHHRSRQYRWVAAKVGFLASGNTSWGGRAQARASTSGQRRRRTQAQVSQLGGFKLLVHGRDKLPELETLCRLRPEK
jgi:hypothetical protein